jgi:hypothetical protein
MSSTTQHLTAVSLNIHFRTCAIRQNLHDIVYDMNSSFSDKINHIQNFILLVNSKPLDSFQIPASTTISFVPENKPQNKLIKECTWPDENKEFWIKIFSGANLDIMKQLTQTAKEIFDLVLEIDAVIKREDLGDVTKIVKISSLLI